MSELDRAAAGAESCSGAALRKFALQRDEPAAAVAGAAFEACRAEWTNLAELSAQLMNGNDRQNPRRMIEACEIGGNCLFFSPSMLLNAYSAEYVGKATAQVFEMRSRDRSEPRKAE